MFLSHMQVSTRNTPTVIQQFQTNPIFFNENIKMGNEPYIINLVLNGIKYINGITKEDGNIYTYDELKTTYNVNINILQYSGLISSVLDWKKKIKLEDIRNKLANPIPPFPVQVYLKSRKGTQDMYNLINKTNDPPPHPHPQVGNYLGIKRINLKIMNGKKYILSYLK